METKPRILSVSYTHLDVYKRQQYQNCVPDQEKTKKVAARVMKTFGMEAYFSLCEVAASHEEDKAEACLLYTSRCV